MKKPLALIFALGLCVPMAAMAQNAPVELTREHFERLDTDNNGKVSAAEYQQFMENAFTKLDTDRNGRLSAAEAGEVLAAKQFTAVDADGSGDLSRQEFLDQTMRDFHRADSDDDGNLRYP